MKTHGPNSPQDIRGLRDRRSSRGVLNTRRMAEADMRTGEMVQPFGNGFFRVKNPGGAVDYIVADQTGGRTFAPGSSIILASDTGTQGESVLGGAPPNKKGGVSRTRSPRRRGTVTAENDYYAFWSDGRAGLYSDGSFVSYRATGGPTIAGTPSLIHADGASLVGDGSIVYRVDSENLASWDVENELDYTYAVPAGYVATPPVYADSWVWWIEREAVQHGSPGAYKTYFRLRKSRTDFSSVSTVATYECEHYIGFSVNWDVAGAMRFALTTSGAIAHADWEDSVATEVIGTINVRIARDGGSAADSGWPAVGPGTDIGAWQFDVGLPTPTGDSFCSVVGGTFVVVPAILDDSETATPASAWPETDDWTSIGVTNPSLSLTGSVAAIYSGTEIVRDVSIPVASGAPTSRFTVSAPLPEAPDDLPGWFYIKG